MEYSFLFIAKTFVTALVVVTIAEVSKRSLPIGSLLASIPITSLLAILWMRFDGMSNRHISQFSHSIIYYTIPSFTFFFLISFLLYRNWNFYISLAISLAVTLFSYLVLFYALGKKF